MACRLTTDAHSVHPGIEIVGGPSMVVLTWRGEVVLEREGWVVWEEFPSLGRRGGWDQDRGEHRCQWKVEMERAWSPRASPWCWNLEGKDMGIGD